ncbi:hypothetical protein QI058_09745 [Staphylococcus saprophyticus]|uniref:helix-turn-helix domain-containing protein n=1 Tax=Staphylococcus saprophyticus TaxID=29385 RepID=UPI00101198B3|nr:hypothetical protein [Staphylococcus saprophyticus]MDL1996077.1 hypothetical protein [Staphylococcus saprophyticus]MDW4329840.1 hypothetical protein [Staphylococcus saprophyticus]MDW4373654.1 hypothetical protein [Staphylococcus saprophyticus]MDW4376293.1 hypothetical protein [Staphylococcus saprophyticus]RXS22927.1 hypothetical protein EUA47_01480 [Staphylococcus saprophyticus]
MNVFRKSRERYHLSQSFVSRKTNLDRQVIEKLETNNIVNENFTNEIIKLIKFYNMDFSDVQCNFTPELKFITRHTGKISENDKQQIGKLLKLQGVL